jgi:GT2 family glycosyltransferase
MLALMEARPEVGISGCRLVRPDGTLDHACRRSFPTILGALGHLTGVGRRDLAPRALSQYRAPWIEAGPVDAVNGAFMLIRRSALEDVGTFDEGYWMYMEDLDLCYRFAQAGWTTWYEPTATAIHVKHGTTGRRRSLRLELSFHRGMARFYAKHYAPERSAATTLVVRAGIGIRLAALLLGRVIPAGRLAARMGIRGRRPTLANPG